MDLRIVAPSFVTLISPDEPDWRILFIPLGPRVDLTRSPRASAPTKDARRAFSAFSSVAWGTYKRWREKRRWEVPLHQRYSWTLRQRKTKDAKGVQSKAGSRRPGLKTSKYRGWDHVGDVDHVGERRGGS